MVSGAGKPPPIVFACKDITRQEIRQGGVSGSFRGTLFWLWLRPQPDQILGEVSHARLVGPGRMRRAEEARGDAAPLVAVAPELRGDARRRLWGILRGGDDRTNLVLKVLSLLGMASNIVKQDLLDPVEAHGYGLPVFPRKTVVKPPLIMALHFFGNPCLAFYCICTLSTPSPMWQKLKEQLPAIILTAVLISGAGFLGAHADRRGDEGQGGEPDSPPCASRTRRSRRRPRRTARRSRRRTSCSRTRSRSARRTCSARTRRSRS